MCTCYRDAVSRSSGTSRFFFLTSSILLSRRHGAKSRHVTRRRHSDVTTIVIDDVVVAGFASERRLQSFRLGPGRDLLGPSSTALGRRSVVSAWRTAN